MRPSNWDEDDSLCLDDWREKDFLDEFTEDGILDGYMSGAEAKLEKWRQDREDREFKKLVRQIYKRNHRQKQIEKDREAFRQKRREYDRRNRDKVNAAQQRRRKARYERNPVVNQCRSCGKIWTAAFESKRKRVLCCSIKCRNAWSGKKRKRGRGINDMQIREKILRYLRSHPLSSSHEIRLAVRGVKTLRCTLWKMTREGLLRRSGRYHTPLYEIHSGDDS